MDYRMTLWTGVAIVFVALLIGALIFWREKIFSKSSSVKSGLGGGATNGENKEPKNEGD
ncbi:hypothetical protein DOLIC_00006 [Dolichomitus sp. PSUC_FEM 10030005]|nr:hypothetical protein [Dolichomitus sp. PSUC_FEM 10030005]